MSDAIGHQEHSAAPAALSLQPVVSCPCVGLNSQARAARLLGTELVCVQQYDIRGEFGSVLQRITGSLDEVFVGKTVGDITKVPIENIERQVDGLIAGPPCPPYSVIGKKLGSQDIRCEVLVVVGLWITRLAHAGMKWFVIENVNGILKRDRILGRSVAEWFMENLRESLPCGWALRVQKVNCKDCGLPHNRPRVFITGTSETMRATSYQRGLLTAELKPHPRRLLAEFLDTDSDSSEDFDRLTVSQQLNVLMHIDRFQRYCESAAAPPSIMVTDAARAFGKEFAVNCAYDEIHCLRTNCSSLWLVPAKHMEKKLGKHGRSLRRDEKSRLCGFAPETLESLSDRELDHALGNRIPVPQLAVVLDPILKCWDLAVRGCSSESA